MKIRQGFVSNSSSASFTIDLHKISSQQVLQIEDHVRYAEEEFGWHTEDRNAWSVSTKGRRFLELYTSMDNFNMSKFLRLIEVPEDAVEKTYH